MPQWRNRILHDVGPCPFSPFGAAPVRDINLGRAVAGFILRTIGVIHRIAICREGGSPFVKFGVHLIFQLFRGQPVPFFILLDKVEIVVVLPCDGIELRLLIFGAGRGKIEQVIIFTGQHRTEFTSPRVELIHFAYLIPSWVLPPFRGLLAPLDTVESQLASRIVGQVGVILLDSFAIPAFALLHLSEAQMDNRVRVVITKRIHISADGPVRTVDHPVTFRHPECNIAAQVPFLWGSLCIEFPVHGRCFVIFADALFFFRIAQLDRFT